MASPQRITTSSIEFSDCEQIPWSNSSAAPLDVDAIALRLESQERFNPDRAKTVAEAFRGSMTEFGLIDGIGNILTVEHAALHRPDMGSVRERRPESPVSRDDQFKVPLGAGRRALLFLPEALGAADVRRIVAILQAYVQEESPS